ncbi:MAG: hypothetical protein K6C94_07255 [Candidatus Gastranaerophilales bacterium]|nr:hypothetical protein [Candidatus Gastranaerophilales bacterium]
MYDIYLLISYFFASPIPILTVIITKIFFGKKFSSKAFWITLIVVFILMVYFSFKIVNGVLYITPFYKLTFSEYFYRYYSDLIFDDCTAVIAGCAFLIPIMILGAVGYFVQTKDKTVFKKLFVSLLVLAPFVYVSFPCYKFVNVLFMSDYDVNRITNDLKYMEDKTVLPPVKAVAARELTAMIQLRENQENINDDYFQSEVFKNFADDFVKYAVITGDMMGYFETDLYRLLYFEKFDEYLKIIEKLENRMNSDEASKYKIEAYIAQKDYQKALETAEKTTFKSDRGKYMRYTRIYAGLKQFDKAYDYLEKYKNTFEHGEGMGWYKKTKIYLDYKSGKTETAKEEYKNMYKYSTNPSPIEDFIKRIERIEY